MVDLDLKLGDVLLGQWSENTCRLLNSLDIWIIMLDVVSVREEGSVKGLDGLEVDSGAALRDVLHGVRESVAEGVGDEEVTDWIGDAVVRHVEEDLLL